MDQMWEGKDAAVYTRPKPKALIPCNIGLCSSWLLVSSGLADERSKCWAPPLPAPEFWKPLTSLYGCELWVGWLEYAWLALWWWWWWWFVPADCISGTDDILRALWRGSFVASTCMARKKLKLVGLLPAETTSLLEEFENVRGLWFPLVLAFAPIFSLSLLFFSSRSSNNNNTFLFLLFTFFN